MTSNTYTMDSYSMVFIPISELRKVIREEIESELQKVPYYSQGSSPDTIMTLEEAAANCKVCKLTRVLQVIAIFKKY